MDQANEILHALGATTLTFRKGETILTEWSPVTHYYLVVSGSVLSFYLKPDGKRSVTGTFSQGDVFGLLFAFTKEKLNPSSAIATSDTTVIRIPIVDIINDDTLIRTSIRRRYIQNAVNTISQSAYVARLRAFVLSNTSVEQRISCYLNELSRHAGCAEFDIPFDRQELADFMDCDRSTLCTTLGKMKAKGIISCHKKRFKIIVPFE